MTDVVPKAEPKWPTPQEWRDELTSGRWKRARDQLVDADISGARTMCCLGVLAHMADVLWPPEDPAANVFMEGFNPALVADIKLAGWSLGGDGDLNLEPPWFQPDDQDELARLNDVCEAGVGWGELNAGSTRGVLDHIDEIIARQQAD